MSEDWLKIYIYRWSMSRWNFLGITSPRATPPERYQMRGGSSRPRNPGFRLEEPLPRWPSRARPRRPSSRPEIAANSVACSSSSGPGTITKPSQGRVKLCPLGASCGGKLGNRQMLRTGGSGFARFTRMQWIPTQSSRVCWRCYLRIGIVIKRGYFLIFKETLRMKLKRDWK